MKKVFECTRDSYDTISVETVDDSPALLITTLAGSNVVFLSREDTALLIEALQDTIKQTAP